MINDLVFAFWFFLPAGVANTAPIIAAKLPLIRAWDAPMDFNLTHNGKRLLGSHKTWRGIISGALAGIAVLALQRHFGTGIDSFDAYLESVGYFDKSLLLGGLLGFGALAGDAAKSLFKRLRGIPEGKQWFPFDQLDYIVGGCALAAFVWLLPLKIYVLIGVVWFVMHLLFSFIGYKLHLKESPI